MRTILTSIMALSLVMITFTFSKTIYYVPQDFKTIQKAIDAAEQGDVIIVRQGTYYENIVITKKITIASEFYNAELNKTGDSTYISRTIIDGSTPSHPDSAATVTFRDGTDSTSTIMGFTITGGKGNKHTKIVTKEVIVSGGGINVHSGGATIKHNVITGNSIQISSGVAWGWGGGIGAGDTFWPIDNSFVIVEENTITGNTVSRNSGVGMAMCGGIGYSGTDGRIRSNNILKNTSEVAGGIGVSNGDYSEVDTVTLEKNLIHGNRATMSGAAVLLMSSTILAFFKNNTVIGNSSDGLYGGISVGDNCSARIDCNYITGNTSANSKAPSGGIYIYNDTNNIVVVNNIIAKNSGHGVVLENKANALIINNTIVDNMRMGIYANYGTKACAINNISSEIYGDVMTSYCLIKGGNFLSLGNDIDADPLFIAGDTLYNLSPGSPCIGSGIPSFTIDGHELFAPTNDYLGRIRPNSGVHPDMGAVECSLDSPTDVVKTDYDIPNEFALSQNYPNPFNPSTTISYRLPVAGMVTLTVNDMLGREVATIVNEQQQAGNYSVQWHADNFSSGTYFYILQAEQLTEMKKMTLVK